MLAAETRAPELAHNQKSFQFDELKQRIVQFDLASFDTE
jgi:hypothetical protein